MEYGCCWLVFGVRVFCGVEVKDNDVRLTPRPLVRECAKVTGVFNSRHPDFGFTLDVAATWRNSRCDSYYDLEMGEDGLEMDWKGDVWCNPPYSEIGKWVTKAWQESSFKHNRTITMLLPANKTEQPWWQELVEPYRSGEQPKTVFSEFLAKTDFKVHFLPGRRKFHDPEGKPIYARDKVTRQIKRNAKGEKIIGSPGFGLVVLNWRNA